MPEESVVVPESPRPLYVVVRDVLKNTGVVFGGFVVLGMGLGVLISSLGLPWWIAPIVSLTVLAGSAEFVLVGLLAAGTPLATIATTTALINSRHLVYGISYPLHALKGFWARLYAIYSLCDEAFALTVSQPRQNLYTSRILMVHLGLHLSWATGSTLGALVGSGFLSQLKGIDFVMTALFVALAIDSFRQTPDRITLTLALFAGLIGIFATPHQMILTSLVLFVFFSILRYFFGSRKVGGISAQQ